MSGKVLIRPDYILMWGEDLEVIRQGELVVEDGFISYLGGRQERHFGDYARVIEGSGTLVLPGLVNAHTHAAMTLFRGYADDLPLMEWLQERIWPLEARLEAEDVYWGSLLGITEMIRGGVTAFADMYFFMDQVARAGLDAGIRASLARGLIGLDPDQGRLGLEETRTLAREWHGGADGRLTIMLGPHAPYTCPPSFLQQTLDLADELDLPLHTHLAETRGEVKDCQSQYGKTPGRYLDDLGFFSRRVLAAHCVHLTPGEIALLAAKGVAVAHNPGSNLKLGSGVAPVHELVQSQALVGLGTDGAASNNNLDVMGEMRLASLLSKGIGEEPTRLGAAQALALATRDGARSLFLPEETGTLRPGSRADLIMLNLDQPHLCPLHNPVAQVVYAARSSDVVLTMVDGRILLENGELLTIDEEKVKHEAQQRADRLVHAP